VSKWQLYLYLDTFSPAHLSKHAPVPSIPASRCVADRDAAFGTVPYAIDCSVFCTFRQRYLQSNTIVDSSIRFRKWHRTDDHELPGPLECHARTVGSDGSVIHRRISVTYPSVVSTLGLPDQYAALKSRESPPRRTVQHQVSYLCGRCSTVAVDVSIAENYNNCNEKVTNSF
jgi:hypothetical protein